jgi:hypothetical protein
VLVKIVQLKKRNVTKVIIYFFLLKIISICFPDVSGASLRSAGLRSRRLAGLPPTAFWRRFDESVSAVIYKRSLKTAYYKYTNIELY